MNSEIPSVPITPLATCTSLSSLIGCLPLPQPLKETLLNNKSLLYTPRLAEEANHVISTRVDGRDPLFQQVSSALSQTNADHIVLKDRFNYPDVTPVDPTQYPDFLRVLLQYNPHVFTGGRPPSYYQQKQHFPVSQVHHLAQQSPSDQSPYSGSVCTPQQSLRTPQSADGQFSADEKSMSLEAVQQLFAKAPVVALPRMEDGQSKTGKDRDAMRQQIVSIGKQPKVHNSNRKRRTMVSELFDSLTPAAEYFAEGSRRKRQFGRFAGEEGDSNEEDMDYAPRTKVMKVKARLSGERNQSDDYECPATPPEVIEQREREWAEIMKRRREKQKRRPMEMIDADEMVESEAYRHFCYCIGQVLDQIEEYDAPADDDEQIPSDCMVPASLVNDLCCEASKLKAMSATNKVPVEQLVRLVTALEKNVRDGVKVIPFILEEGENDAIREMFTRRIQSALDAAIVVLTIMTSFGMPKLVYIEDAIERAISLAKALLTNVIYPAYDPVYRATKKEKEAAAKAKKSKGAVKDRWVTYVYGRLGDLLGLFAELIEIQPLTDTSVLQLSPMSIGPFFVENVREIQINALRLVANIFAVYEKHRPLLIEELMAGLARLPITKRGMRTYRLGAEEYIQMVTALVMQLVQSVVRVPSSRTLAEDEEIVHGHNPEGMQQQDKDVVVMTTYENAMRTARGFLTIYLKKCTAKLEDDYRPLFDAFVDDLLTAVNRPEWPTAELLLSLLGKLLVQHFSNKTVDMSLRVASLDYLGKVAARLRSDAVNTQLDEAQLRQIVQHVTCEPGDDDYGRADEPSEDRMQILQRALVDYLIELKDNDPLIDFAKQFYIGQWYHDTSTELAATIKRDRAAPIGVFTDDDEDTDIGSRTAQEEEKFQAAIQKATATKQFLLTLIDRDKNVYPGSRLQQSHCMLDEDRAGFVVRYLASRRPFSRSFDIYLMQILNVLNDSATQVRAKAMKCLTSVVEADPSVLERADIQEGVRARLMDSSANVREAAVDLVAKFVLIRPNLIQNYYQMLVDRILDNAVSVRKRVIKALRDICIEQPDFEKVPEICVRIIRRVNDEEGVRKLVAEVFHSLWFAPVRDRDTVALLKKVVNITDAVAACKDTGYDWFESLLGNLLGKDGSERQVLNASKQIVDCLVENVLALEKKTVDTNSSERNTNHERLLACLTTLYLFSRVKPILMVPHAETMQPYLTMKCSGAGEQAVLVQVIKILELAIPLMDHPSPKFLAQIEDNLLRLMHQFGQQVVVGCVACLAAILRKTNNYTRINEHFVKLFSGLRKFKADYEQNGGRATKDMAGGRPTLLRALFIIGSLYRHFDVDEHLPPERRPAGTQAPREQVFEGLLYFTQHGDEEIQVKALISLGYMCVNFPDYLMTGEVKSFYLRLLKDPRENVKLKGQVLRNLEIYLKEEENKMTKTYEDWNKAKKTEDLKELGDVTSGMASSVIQLYLTQVQEAYYNCNLAVRLASAAVTLLTLQQGLVHPVASLPHLIAMTTDSDQSLRIKTENMLKDIESKYTSSFLQMKAVQGLKQSFILQRLLQQDPGTPVRGLYTDATQAPAAVNAHLYTLMRNSRQYRRGLLQSVVKMFDDSSHTPLEELVYLADNVACFPYLTLDEPLFVIHQTDSIVAVAGSSLLQAFQENLLPKPRRADDAAADDLDDEDDETVESVLQRLPASDLRPLDSVITASQGCILLLMLKQTLKDMYGLTEAKVREYTPSEAAKAYDKTAVRKAGVRFQPRFALEHLSAVKKTGQWSNEDRRKLCKQYLDFKQLIYSIDQMTTSSDESESGVDEGRPSSSLAPEGTLDAPANIITHFPVAYPQQQMYMYPTHGDMAAYGMDPYYGNVGAMAGLAQMQGFLQPGTSALQPPRIVMTIARDSGKVKSDNMYKDVIKPTGTGSATLSMNAQKMPHRKRKQITGGQSSKKKRKRRQSDADSDNPDDEDYVG